MVSKQKFFICKHCGNLVGMVHNAGVKMVCCGEAMHELAANTTDAAVEKHLPIVSVEGNKVTVTVSSTIHPMVDAHYIGWVYLETEKGGQRKELEIGKDPVATFVLEDDKPIAAFAYCNLHGLWKTEV